MYIFSLQLRLVLSVLVMGLQTLVCISGAEAEDAILRVDKWDDPGLIKVVTHRVTHVPLMSPGSLRMVETEKNFSWRARGMEIIAWHDEERQGDHGESANRVRAFRVALEKEQEVRRSSESIGSRNAPSLAELKEELAAERARRRGLEEELEAERRYARKKSSLLWQVRSGERPS